MVRKTKLVLTCATIACAAFVSGNASALSPTWTQAKSERGHGHYCTSADVFSAYDGGTVAECARTRAPAYAPEPTYEYGGAFTISGINGI